MCVCIACAALLEHLRRTCGARAGAGVIAQQHLFTVYIHVGSNEKNWTGALHYWLPTMSSCTLFVCA